MIYFVLPAFNEEANVGRTLSALRGAALGLGEKFHIVLVDDGSADRTAELARQALEGDGEVVGYGGNRGVAEAFRAGFKHVLSKASTEDVLVTMEADGTADLSTLPKLLEKIRQGCDVALASCYMEGGAIIGTTPLRRYLSRIANGILKTFFPLKNIHTYSAFYRAYRVTALNAVLARYGDFYREKGYACVIELLFRLAKLQARIEEVPTVLKGDERIGKSKMKVLKTIGGYLRVVRRHVAGC